MNALIEAFAAGWQGGYGYPISRAQVRYANALSGAEYILGYEIDVPSYVSERRHCGTLEAIGRADNPHGVPLGGYRWQRRAALRRANRAAQERKRRVGICIMCDRPEKEGDHAGCIPF